MKYFIDYNNLNGEIIGFLTEHNIDKKKNTTVEVTKNIFLEAQKHKQHNTISIVDGNIIFSLVDYSTLEEQKKTKDKKNWEKYNIYHKNLTISLEVNNNIHKYAVSEAAYDKIDKIQRSPYMLNNEEIVWKEEWGAFMTNKVELEKVLFEADVLLQNKIVELFGDQI